MSCRSCHDNGRRALPFPATHRHPYDRVSPPPLYLHAGVGFSYSNTTSDYTVGDARAAADVYAFLQGFLAQPDFSHLADNDLYISGESYGGCRGAVGQCSGGAMQGGG